MPTFAGDVGGAGATAAGLIESGRFGEVWSHVVMSPRPAGLPRTGMEPRVLLLAPIALGLVVIGAVIIRAHRSRLGPSA